MFDFDGCIAMRDVFLVSENVFVSFIDARARFFYFFYSAEIYESEYVLFLRIGCVVGLSFCFV